MTGTSRFTVSYPAAAQFASLPSAEKSALERLFASDEIDRPTTTKPTGDGRFVSRLGGKRVLWRRESRDGRPEILSIVDHSFVQA
ncbi:hypothetical protein [Methylobacterium oryzihabitans]|uniref:Cytotoxic translational repressor of toxin-antitoxin stability system n=1 Tax=Methylobacterium oryzihabitans TaxID=2499852 RepID=A0A3S2XMW5_9HYPH|nr:hypothetical protein [Methylobacterium oryzihabitans]RVU18662.1 hypothetical protein EOE48_09740 [Methylobacterium oryzihabitans]